MILVIDNYDSFTYNLVQYLGELGAGPEVRRNDAVTHAEIERMHPAGIILSPGPKSPEETEPANEIVRRFAGRAPILGVCLGHQCIAHVNGARVVRAERLMHGKTSQIIHHGEGIFAGMDNPFPATRYHSLIVSREGLPERITVTAWTAEGEIMGLKVRDQDVWGVQFHPESILTRQGKKLLENFLVLCAS